MATATITTVSNIKTGEAGFSLIEIMVVFLVFTVGILAQIQMQVKSIETNSAGRRITQMASLGTDRLEKLMSLPYDALDANSTTTVVDEHYEVKWEVSDADIPIENVKTITVTTTWTQGSQQRSRSNVYYKANE